MHKKIKSLLPFEEIEQEVINQIWRNVVDLPFLKKLAIMPDVHTGYHLPIGCVAELENVISPSFIGYDIGCGMCSIISNVKFDKDIDFYAIKNDILRSIPVGFNMRKNPLDYQKFESAIGDKNLDKKVNKKLFRQLGTLGGGNHFIEIGKNKNDFLTITVHSGSRNPGHSVADYYMKLSKNEEKELPNGFFSLDGYFGQCYIHDMNFMLEYALENRIKMIDDIRLMLGIFSKINVNENHNHAVINNCDSTVTHRKGATPAKKGQLGLIPANMKDGVFLTKGLGNEEYLSSASHGAGRKMSRTKARKNISMEDFEQQMEGIIGTVSENTLDEAPDAYKDIKGVLRYQEGIVVDIIDHFEVIVNVKG